MINYYFHQQVYIYQAPAKKPAQPPSLVWLALALALALVGVVMAQLFISAGIVAAAIGYALATVPVTGGLGIALGLLGIEVLV